MEPLVVVESEVVLEPSSQFWHGSIVLEVNVLVFDRPPEAFDKDVIEGAATAVHADADASGFEAASEFQGGELHALVGVEDLGMSSEQRLPQRVQAKPALQCVGQLPG